MIPCTDSGSGAVIPTQREPNAGATNEPGATAEPRAINSNGNAERIDPERDLQITSGLNGQQRPRRTLRPTFKVQENQLITEILQQSTDPRNRHALLVLMSQCTEDADPEEPKTLDEALSGPNRTQWLAAAHAEVKSLRAKGVYCLVDRSPKMKVLSGKWVFKLKRDQDGNIIRFKARYVVKGFMQQLSVDYSNTYANVADIDTIQLLLAMACFYD
jgi:hypothetical protein